MMHDTSREALMMTKRWDGSATPSLAEQRAAKRNALIRKAAQAFRIRGFYATSMDDIAASLGVTKGALYRYVKSKQDILFECFSASYQIAQEGLGVARDNPGTGLQKLEAFVVHFVENYLAQNTAGGAMVDIDALFPEQKAHVIAGRDAIDAALRDIVRVGIADGSIIDRDPKLTVLTLMGAINWIPSWYQASKAWTARDIALATADIFVRGLQGPTVKPTRSRGPTR